MQSSGKTTSSAPSSRARPIHSATFAALPSTSPTVGSIWARARRTAGSWRGSRLKYRRWRRGADRLRLVDGDGAVRRLGAGARPGLAVDRCRRCRDDLADRPLEVEPEAVEVGHRVVVADEAEVDLAVVGHDPDAERLAASERHEREDR